MVDSLAMFFGAKKRRKSPSKKRDYKDHGKIVVGGKERKLMKGVNGGLYYKTKSGRTYVDAAFVRKHRSTKRKSSPKRRRASPKRRRASPKRRRASPKRRRASPKRRRSSPKRRRSSPKRRVRRTRYGYGLGQPSLIDMMGPAGLVPIGRM
jgi:hypothetical protein